MGHLFLGMITYLSIGAAAYNGTYNSATIACQQLKGDLSNSTYVPSQSEYLPLSEKNWYKFPVVLFFMVLD